MALHNSVLLITSSAQGISRFGTGFVIRQSGGLAHVLTCDHVVEDVGGSGKVLVEGKPASVVASGKEEGIDLAVLRVEGLGDKSVMRLRGGGQKGRIFETAGFQVFGQDCLVRPLKGQLGDQVGLQSRLSEDRIQAWDLRVAEDYALQPGYSGSPIIDQFSGDVLGVVSHRQGENRGLAISIDELNKIWTTLDSDRFFRVLLPLGYRPHERLFRELPEGEAVAAAFLIYGFREYGPCWLLNRLLMRNVASCLTGQVFKSRLTRRGRGIGVEAIWRELAGRVGARGRSPSEIVERIYQWWQTQDVILIFHEVNFLPESELHQLIDVFWALLTEKIGDPASQSHANKLLMFLVDYEEKVENWEIPFAEGCDSNWYPKVPIKLPKIPKFSSDDLLDWLYDQAPNLTRELTKTPKKVVQSILAESEDGVPIYAFEVICNRCGWNWYEESEKWLQRVE